MARYNVNHNNKWACFSTIVDDFVTEFMCKEDYEKWRKIEYGLKDYEPAEKCNIMTIDEAVHYIKLNRTYDETITCLVGTGLSEEESKQIINNLKDKY